MEAHTVSKHRNRIHLLLVIDDDAHGRRFFAACAPHLSVESCTSKRLEPHVQLVTCPGCQEQVRLVRKAMTKSRLLRVAAPPSEPRPARRIWKLGTRK